MIHLAPQRLLWTHVWDSAHHYTRLSLRLRADVTRYGLYCSRHLRQTEVQHLHLPARGQHEVRRFDVAMRDPLAVRFVQGVRNLTSDLYNLADLQRMAVDPGCERLSFDILHRDEAHAF